MSEPGVGRFLVALSLQGLVFILLVFAIELQGPRTIRRALCSLFSICCSRCTRRSKVRGWRHARTSLSSARSGRW